MRTPIKSAPLNKAVGEMSKTLKYNRRKSMKDDIGTANPEIETGKSVQKDS